MIKWNEFAWAAFLYGAIGGDNGYQKLMCETIFLNQLRKNPNSLTPENIRDKLIYFLNKWKTRVSRSIETSTELKKQIIFINPYLNKLKRYNIATASFNESIIIESNKIIVSDAVAKCYNAITKVHGIGPTATAKILHVLQPRFFVMWDTPILNNFKNKYPPINNSGKGYAIYLRKMQDIAKQINQDFWNTIPNLLNIPPHTPEDYLSFYLKYDPVKTMAKYLDEFYWVTITNNVEVPPTWHP